ncbi:MULTISPECIES: pyrroloquinoline quinone biosynthesis protein PqqE [Streptomyces]|uniref:PqqA peptide cyclase n=3 Tax=Streptomyces TaxID=1883 RepID=PQQE_STRRO|nr:MULTISPECIES: pyrroloquinoline quinone biosynthesis protein PqqE [Streptomyces]P59749.1 RecName: Full=PqqA peptide cyclase; AltName: Full=Coenzyme PQQ synthesis protein E; AltName: Full=Pyrroloquinoline quinone biosynthesis protein E [Streptomyces rochei]ADN64220.1 pyrroloquinoline quinone biosynthesis protein E [Streptomyces rochei subsp. volubilis]MBA9050712.1 pyrroloquinoline quinone biosynthesis protein E [Streptomyces murinus]QNT98110.1 pyrroloquinoline quinone biosynthesis protein E [S
MADPAVGAPAGMLIELTHRCPLHCPYCSNPLELVRREAELTCEQWTDILTQARELGVVQMHFSGGEPLARPDLPDLVGHARRLGAYVNLVTSGVGLTAERAHDLARRGVDHVQLSLQDADPAAGQAIAGARVHTAKLEAARAVTAAGLPLTVNIVLHRGNIDRTGRMVDLAVDLGADRIELANTQYYGWGLRNRAALMPTAAQLAAAREAVRHARTRYAGGPELVYVAADYYDDRPKPCMDGWGSTQLTVTPAGDVLPCPAAYAITTLPVENALRRPLSEIWYASRSFNAYRGTGWMREPCRTCPERHADHGGCRCQAFQLTGDAAATDPACGLSPHRSLVDAALAEVTDGPVPAFVPRGPVPA